MSNVYHMFMCWKCGKKTVINGTVSRSDECPNCGADIRCCRNCKFYAPGAHFDCHETSEELVVDKEKANFCDYFKLNATIPVATDKVENAKDVFNSLFGD